MLISVVFPCLAVLSRDGGARMDYSVVGGGEGVVSVVDGVLVSGLTPGHAALQITAHEESGITQTLILVVKVRASPTSYIFIQVRSKNLHINTQTPILVAWGRAGNRPVGLYAIYSPLKHLRKKEDNNFLHQEEIFKAVVKLFLKKLKRNIHFNLHTTMFSM